MTRRPPSWGYAGVVDPVQPVIIPWKLDHTLGLNSIILVKKLDRAYFSLRLPNLLSHTSEVCRGGARLLLLSRQEVATNFVCPGKPKNVASHYLRPKDTLTIRNTGKVKEE